jgi:hypothetical protein
VRPVAAAAAVLVAASPSSTPTHGQLLGGGSVGSRPAAGHADVAYTTIRVSKDGKSVHFYGDWPARCARGVATASIDRVIPLQPDGSFVGAGVLNTAAAVGTFELRGRLERRSIGGLELDAGSGNGSAELAPRAPGSATCRTGSVAWQVRAAPRIVGPPTPKPGAPYFGNDSDTDPVVLRVSPDGSSTVQAGLEFGLRCRYSRFRFASEIVPATPIGRDGRFSAVHRYTSTLAGSRYSGASARFTATLAGRFAASTVAGSLAVDVRITARTGALVDTCHARTSFTASL